MTGEIRPCSKLVGNVLGGKGRDTDEARKVSRGQAQFLEAVRTDEEQSLQSCSGSWQGAPRGST